MILFYSAACAAVLAWRFRASWRAWIAKRGYERAESAFREVERLCKLDEVQIGRPMDYAGQLRLLKAFETRENRKSRWSRAALSLARTNRAWTALRGFQGRRTSYLSGVFDVALIWAAQRHLSPLWESAAQVGSWLETVRRLW
jgi:hypothetical protein